MNVNRMGGGMGRAAWLWASLLVVACDASSTSSGGADATGGGAIVSPWLDASSPTADGRTPTNDAGPGTMDATSAGADGAPADASGGVMPTVDAGESSDAAPPLSDGRIPGPDAVLPGADAVLPGADAVLPGADAVLPGADAVLPGADAAPPNADAAPSSADAAPPGADAAPPNPDAALPPVECVADADCLGRIPLRTCAVAVCDPASNTCQSAPVANATPCDDADPCTVQDTCTAGVCAGSALVCDDLDPCTDDACVDGRCEWQANTAPCDDGDACTFDDVCAAEVCSGAPVQCDDGDDCTADACEAGTCVEVGVPTCPAPRVLATFGANDLRLAGAALINAGVVDTTPGAGATTGAAWLPEPVTVANGLTSTFVFRSEASLSFVVQTGGPRAASDTDPALDDFLAVTIGVVEAPGGSQSVEVRVSSAAGPLATATVSGDWRVDLTHRATVAVDETGLSLALDGATVLSRFSLPAEASFALPDGRAWFGFTGRSGAGGARNEVLSWSVESACTPAACGADGGGEQCGAPGLCEDLGAESPTCVAYCGAVATLEPPEPFQAGSPDAPILCRATFDAPAPNALVWEVEWAVGDATVLRGVAPRDGVAQTTLAALGDAAGGAVQKDEVVGCRARLLTASEGAWSDWSSAPVGNTAPVIDSVTLAPVLPFETFVCVIDAADVDPDVLTFEVIWEATERNGVRRTLDAYGTELAAAAVSRTETVRCTAVYRDGDAVVQRTSNDATVLNRAPTATSPTQGGTTWRSATLGCALDRLSDADGDAVTAQILWFVNGQQRRNQAITPGQTLNFSGPFALGDVVLCRIVPNDGLVNGAPVEISWTVGNHVPRCNTATLSPREPASGYTTQQTVTCGCSNVQDFDSDVRSTTCRWFQFPDTPLNWGPGCTKSMANVSPGLVFDCEARPVDAAGEGTSVRVRGMRDNNLDPTWPPGSFVSISTDVPLDIDTVRTARVTCDWLPTALDNNNAVRYTAKVRVENVATTTIASNLVAGPASFFVRDLDMTNRTWRAGQRLQCQITATDGRAEATAPSGWIAVADSPAVVTTFGVAVLDPANPGRGELGIDYLTPGLEARCDAAYTDPDGSAQLQIDLERNWAPGQAVGNWTTVATTSRNGLSGTTRWTWDGAGPAADVASLRCVARKGGAVLATSPPFPLLSSTPEVSSAVLSPEVSSPCDVRTCTFTVEDDDAALAPYALDLDVEWLVNGVAQGQTRTRADLVPGLNVVEVSADDVPVAGGQTLACRVTARKGNLEAEATSDPARVEGDGGRVGSARIVEASARAGEQLHCVAEDVVPGCAAVPVVRYRWYADDVLIVGADAPTLDTSDLEPVESLRCAASVAQADGGAGPETRSTPVPLAPPTWTLRPAPGAVAEMFGLDVAVLDDLDGDGWAELGIGAPNATVDGAVVTGKVYVVRGRAAIDTVVDPSNAAVVTGSRGITPIGDPRNPRGVRPGSVGFSDGDGLGTRVIASRDVTGDGTGDLIVASPYALARGSGSTGRVYVFDGAALTNRIGQPAVTAESVAHGLFEGARGGDVAGLDTVSGDYTGDGRPDLCIGAGKASTGDDALHRGNGRVFCVADARGGWLADLLGSANVVGPNAPPPSDGFVTDGPVNPLAGYELGASRLQAVGDLDGDGADDVVVSTQNFTNRAYIVRGRNPLPRNEATRQGVADNLTLSSLTDPGLVRIDGGNSSFAGGPDAWPIELVRSGRLNFFSNPSGPGDVDGDGWLDLVVGALARVDNVNQVQINVVLGAGGRLSGDRDVDLDAVERGIGGWTIEGLPGEGSLSTTVATWRVGDVNHDGLDDVGFVLRPAPPNHSAPVLPVRLYIAYGNAVLASPRLTDLEQGRGGFTLDLPDWPTRVTAGDVDGDGLSDLVFGFASNDAIGRIDGSAQVRFGIDTGTLDAHGGPGDEALSGTPGADRMAGGRGDDVLSGLGGADVLAGGAGDDVLEVADATFVRLDGGRGEDTLRVDGDARVTLDLDALRERVRGVEVIDLTGAPVSLTLSASRVRRLPSEGAQMVVVGDADDVLASPRSAWRAGGDAVWNGQPARRYTDGAATLLVVGPVQTRLPPSAVTLQLEVRENAANGTVVGPLTGADPDGTVVLARIQGGDPFGAFTYDTVNGALVVADSAQLDFETRPRFTLRVELTDDNGLTGLSEVVVSLRNQNEAPFFPGPQAENVTAPEGAPVGRVLTVFQAEDPDADEVVTYSLARVEPADRAGAFALDADSGTLTVADGTLLDFEATPLITVVARATDAGGLTDEVSLDLELRDVENFATDFTAHFVSTGQSLWEDGPVGFLDSTLGHSLDTPPGTQADLAGFQGNTIGLEVQSTGNLDVGLEFDIGLGQMNALVPIALTLSMPDQLPVGGSFTMGSSWALTDEARIWGRTPSVQASMSLDFGNISMGGIPRAIAGVVEAIPFRAAPRDTPLPPFEFDLPGQNFVGVPFTQVYPDGLPEEQAHCWAFDCSYNGTIEAVWNGAASAINAANDPEITQNNENVDDWDALTRDETFFDAQQYPNLIMTQQVYARAFEFPLDPQSIADYLVGAAWAGGFGPWWGSFTFQFEGGEARLRYDLWSSQFFFNIDVYEAFYLNVDRVTVTLTLEDGTVIRDLPVGEDARIDVPAGVDRNGDGRVDIRFDYTVHTTFTHFLVDIPLLSYRGKTLGIDYGVYRHVYDLQGRITGQTPISTGGWGPISESEMTIGRPQNRSDSWALPGFQTVTAQGRFQLAR